LLAECRVSGNELPIAAFHDPSIRVSDSGKNRSFDMSLRNDGFVPKLAIAQRVEPISAL
jgi:hypothetical protein